MRRLCASLLGMVAVGLAPVCTAGDSSTEARGGIEAAYKKFDSAVARKDMDGILALCTSDYESVTEKGQKITREQMKIAMAQALAAAKSISITSTVQKVTAKRNSATASVKQRANMVLTNPQTKKTAHMTADETSEDIWVKTAKGWLLKHSKTLTSKTNIK